MDGVAAVLPWAFLLVLCDAALPAQLIMTGSPETMEALPEDVKANIMKTRALSPGLKFRWFGDAACRQYIKDHYDDELVQMFDTEMLGMYRGDICRSAVLYKEGGFYTDIDVEMAVPLTSIVDKNTTFTSAFSLGGDIFNAIIATEPQSEVLAENLQEIRRWKTIEADPSRQSTLQGLMGTQCMYRALGSVVNKSCGASLEAKMKTTQWTCGHHNLKMYREDRLLCSGGKRGLIVNDVVQKDLAECGSAARQDNKHPSVQLGLFPAGQPIYPNRSFIGWSRFSGCGALGCGAKGHDLSLTEMALKAMTWKWKQTAPGVWAKVRVWKQPSSAVETHGEKEMNVEQTPQGFLDAIKAKAYARRAQKLAESLDTKDKGKGFANMRKIKALTKALKADAQMDATSHGLSKDKLSESLDAKGEGNRDAQIDATSHVLLKDKGLMRREEAPLKWDRSTQQA